VLFRSGRRLCVLVLPAPVEALAFADLLTELLRAPGVVAIEPGRVPFATEGRPARLQAKRLLRRLPGRPAVVVAFDPRQRPLASAMADRITDAELWDGLGADAGTVRGRLAQRGVDVSRS
jgi:hypothetical protein